jgi:Putative lumazine-binding
MMNSSMVRLVGEAVMIRIVVAAVAITLLPAAALAQASDEQEVRAVINQYFKGHATADPVEMRKAFWPTAHVEGVRDGKFVSWTVEEYCSRFNGKPAADEASRKRTIDRVEVSGSAAMAGATLVHGRTTFTDYFVLLKEGNTWKIANKVYSSRATN